MSFLKNMTNEEREKIIEEKKRAISAELDLRLDAIATGLALHHPEELEQKILDLRNRAKNNPFLNREEVSEAEIVKWDAACDAMKIINEILELKKA